MNLDAQIEAILFWKGEPLKIAKLADILGVSKDEVEKGIEDLRKKLTGRGVVVQTHEDEVTIGTNGEMSSVIEKMQRDELSKDLGKAGLETLTIILYQGPVKRSEIDYIRGVNSQFILRNLLIRGLIERVSDPKDERSYLYKPTLNLLSHLGLSKIEDLPEFGTIKTQLEEAVQKTPDNSLSSNGEKD